MKAQTSWRHGGVAPWAILAGFFVLWIIFFSLTPPQGGGADVFVFRDAGYNWAQGRGLTAASVPHHVDTEPPALFASYPPGDPLLFGAAASLFGGSGSADTLGSLDTFFNLTFGAVACFLLYLCFSLADPSPSRRFVAVLLLGLVLPTGLVVVDHDRPEVPALCLLLVILLLWRGTFSRSSSWTCSMTGKSLLFASLGLVFLIHPFAGIVGWLLLTFLLIFNEPASGHEPSSEGEPVSQPNGWATRLWALSAGTAVGALIVAVCALFMWHLDHTSLHRFLEHATGKGTGIGVVLESRGSGAGARGASFRSFFSAAAPATTAAVISLLVSGLVVALYAFRGPRRRRRLLECALLLLVLVVFPLAVFPNQANYFGLSRALLLAALFVGGFPLAGELRGSRAPLALLLVSFIFLAPWTGLEALKNWEARASYSKEQGQAGRVRAYFDKHGMANPEMLVDPGHYFLYKRYFPNLHDLSYLRPDDPTGQYQGLVLCYSSSRAFSRAELPWDAALPRKGWRLIDGGEDTLRITLFGRPVMRRNWTWMCDVYARLG